MATSTTTKAFENRVRRMAERQRFAMHKSRRRDPLATDYGQLWLREVDCPTPDRSSNAWHGPYESLEEVEAYLRTKPEHAWAPMSS